MYTVAYALSIVASGRARKIYLAGFDGYEKNDRRLKIVDSNAKYSADDYADKTNQFLDELDGSLKKKLN